MILRVSLVLLAAACVDLGYGVDPVTSSTPVAGSGGGGGCEEGVADPAPGGPRVEYRSMTADPPSLSVPVGAVVTWTNADTAVHSVVAGDPGAELPPALGGFDSGDLASGASFAFRFCRPRSVTYFCRPHAGQMRGYRVEVGP